MHALIAVSQQSTAVPPSFSVEQLGEYSLALCSVANANQTDDDRSADSEAANAAGAMGPDVSATTASGNAQQQQRTRNTHTQNSNVDVLISMGFSMARAMQALAANNNSVERAAEWLLDDGNEEDEAVDEEEEDQLDESSSDEEPMDNMEAPSLGEDEDDRYRDGREEHDDESDVPDLKAEVLEDAVHVAQWSTTQANSMKSVISELLHTSRMQQHDKIPRRSNIGPLQAAVEIAAAEEALTVYYARLAVIRLMRVVPEAAFASGVNSGVLAAITSRIFLASSAEAVDNEVEPRDLIRQGTAGGMRARLDAAFWRWANALSTEQLSEQIIALVQDLCVRIGSLQKLPLDRQLAVTVSSRHNYAANCKTIRVMKIPGAHALVVQFDPKSETNSRDSLRLFSSANDSGLKGTHPPAGSQLRKCSGETGDTCWTQPLIVRSDTLAWRFDSRSDTRKWGYCFTVHAVSNAPLTTFTLESLHKYLSNEAGTETYKVTGVGEGGLEAQFHQKFHTERCDVLTFNEKKLFSTNGKNYKRSLPSRTFSLGFVSDSSQEDWGWHVAISMPGATPGGVDAVHSVPSAGSGQQSASRDAAGVINVPYGIQYGLPKKFADGMQVVYEENYAHATTHEDIVPPPTMSGTHLLVAAARVGSDTFELAAVGERDVVLAESYDNTTTEHNGVHWYLVPGRSFGFSPSDRVYLNRADTESTEGDSRLSWHLHGNGGYRCGMSGSLNTSTEYMKFVYCFTPESRQLLDTKFSELHGEHDSSIGEEASYAFSQWIFFKIIEMPQVPTSVYQQLHDTLAKIVLQPGILRVNPVPLMRMLSVTAKRLHKHTNGVPPPPPPAGSAMLASIIHRALSWQLHAHNTETRLLAPSHVSALAECFVQLQTPSVGHNAPEPPGTPFIPVSAKETNLMRKFMQVAEVLDSVHSGAKMPPWFVYRLEERLHLIEADFPCGVQENLSKSYAQGMTEVYNQPYSHSTSVESITPGPEVQGTHLLVAGGRADSNTFAVAAIGERDEVLRECNINETHENNGVFWYFVPAAAFGFAPSSQVRLSVADIERDEGHLRLSWHISDNTGNTGVGYRCGNDQDLQDSTFRKYVYCFTPTAEDAGPGRCARREVMSIDPLALDNSLWPANLDAHLVRYASEVADKLGLASLKSLKPEQLFPSEEGIDEEGLLRVSSQAVPMTAETPTSAAGPSLLRQMSLMIPEQVGPGPVPKQFGERYASLASRPISGLQGRWAVLQLFNSLVEPVASLFDLKFATRSAPVTGAGDLAAANPERATLAQELLLSKGRLFPSMKNRLLVKALTIASVEGSLRRVKVERGSARLANARCGKDDGGYTVFGQVARQLKDAPLLAKPSTDEQVVWRVDFEGEGGVDHGGLFRESIRDMAGDLCHEDPEGGALKLLIKVPNAATGSINCDCWLPRPSANTPLDLERFCFLGKLLGCAIRSGNPLAVNLPPVVFKLLLFEPAGLRDLADVDQAAARALHTLCTQTPAGSQWDAVAPTWRTTASDGTVIQLAPRAPCVRHEDRAAYFAAALNARLHESRAQVDAMRAGLESNVPRSALRLLTWRQLERAVCGQHHVTVAALQSIVSYRMNKDEQRVQWLWRVLEEGTDEDRSAFLAFATGRSRLPVDNSRKALVLAPADESHGDSRLPTAGTCSMTFYVPRYSSFEVMRERVLKAIHSCRAMDNDTRARGNLYGDLDAAAAWTHEGIDLAAARGGAEAVGAFRAEVAQPFVQPFDIVADSN